MYIDILLEQIHACGLQVETLVVDVKNNFLGFSAKETTVEVVRNV